MNNPKVTIIIPTWNRAEFIESAIQSVLFQTFADFELLILDDASTDNTAEILKKYLNDQRIKYVKHPANLGIAKNRNHGLKMARGECIAMLDSDDIWLDKNKLKRQVEFLDSHPEYGLIGTFTRRINNDGKETISFYPTDMASRLFLASTDLWMRESFLIRNQIYQSSVLMRKSTINELGFYDENLPIWEDYELWLRIGVKYKFRNIPEGLVGYRTHPKKISRDQFEKGLEASWKILNLYKNKYPNYYFGALKLVLKKLLFIQNQ